MQKKEGKDGGDKDHYSIVIVMVIVIVVVIIIFITSSWLWSLGTYYAL